MEQEIEPNREVAKISEIPTGKVDAELEAKHGDNKVARQGRASEFVEGFEMPVSEHHERSEIEKRTGSIERWWNDL
jgi:hypothetical protein